MVKVPNPAGHTGFGIAKSPGIQEVKLVSGLGKNQNKRTGGALAYNPKTGQYAYGGEILDTVQDLSRKRDELRNKGYKGDFKEVGFFPEGFHEVDDESVDKIDKKLGYGQGLIDVFMGRKRIAQEEMMNDLDKIKNPKERAEKSKKWSKYIGDNFPITEAGDTGYLSNPLTAITRDVRQVAGRDTGAEIVGQGLGAAIGGAAGPIGAVVGRGIGSKVSKEMVGTKSSINDIRHTLELQGVNTSDKDVLKAVTENVELGGDISSVIDAVPGGVGKIGTSALKKGAIREIIKKHTKKGLSEQAAKKAALKEVAKKKAQNKIGKQLNKLESPILGEGLSTGVEGMAANQAMTEVLEGRNPTFGESIEAFGEAGAKGMAVGGAVSGLGYGSGKLASKGPELYRKHLNKQVVNEINNPTQQFTENTIKVKAKADGVDFDVAKANLVKEYSSLQSQNVDLADKLTSDYSGYVNKIKGNKRKAKTPEEHLETATTEEIASNITEENSNAKTFNEEDFGVNSMEELTQVRSPKLVPLPEEMSAILEIKNPIEYIDALKNAPWDIGVKKGLFKQLIDSTPESLIKSTFVESGITLKPSEFDYLVLNSVNPDGKIDGGDFTKAYNASEMSPANLRTYAENLNIPSLSKMLDDLSYSETLKIIQKIHGKVSGPEQKILNIGGGRGLNLEIPASMKKGVSGESKSNQKNYKGFAKEILSNHDIKVSVKNGKFAADGVNIKKINDLVQDKLHEIDPTLDLGFIKNTYKRKRFKDKNNAHNGFWIINKSLKLFSFKSSFFLHIFYSSIFNCFTLNCRVKHF